MFVPPTILPFAADVDRMHTQHGREKERMNKKKLYFGIQYIRQLNYVHQLELCHFSMVSTICENAAAHAHHAIVKRSECFVCVCEKVVMAQAQIYINLKCHVDKI